METRNLRGKCTAVFFSVSGLSIRVLDIIYTWQRMMVVDLGLKA